MDWNVQFNLFSFRPLAGLPGRSVSFVSSADAIKCRVPLPAARQEAKINCAGSVRIAFCFVAKLVLLPGKLAGGKTNSVAYRNEFELRACKTLRRA